MIQSERPATVRAVARENSVYMYTTNLRQDRLTQGDSKY